MAAVQRDQLANDFIVKLFGDLQGAGNALLADYMLNPQLKHIGIEGHY